MEYRGVLCCVLVLGLLAGRPARGDDAATAARADYQEATRQYALAEYPAALAAFKRAYLKYPAPAFLYNMAQCHRAMGERALAVRFYRNYLELAPSAPDRGEVQKIIDELEAAIAREPKVVPTPTPRVVPTPTPTPTPRVVPTVKPVTPVVVVKPPAPPDHRPLVKRPLFWGLLAGAVAVVAVGVTVGVVVGTQEHDPSSTLGTLQWGR